MTVSIEQISAYHDSEASPSDGSVTAAHVRDCADCRAALRSWDEASRILIADEPSIAGGRRRMSAAAAAAVMTLLLVGSGVAAATGLFSDIFKIDNVTAVASRPVTLDEARDAARLPLPGSDRLAGGWQVNQVQLTLTSTWRSVDVQYRRAGSRGMNVTVWSPDIVVEPIATRRETMLVDGRLVEVLYDAESTTARFVHQGSIVFARVFSDEVDLESLRAVIRGWVAEAR